MEVVRLKLFPFSLKEKAKLWFYGLRPRFIGTSLEKKIQYFSLQHTMTLRRKITLFIQNEKKSFYECWERYQDLINFCSIMVMSHGE